MNDPIPDPTLRELREEIARIDHAIVFLVAARIRAARRAIEWRTVHGEDRTNRSQELIVRDRTREWAKQVALPPEFAAHLIQALIVAGKEPEKPSEQPLPPLPAHITCRLGSLTAAPPPAVSLPAHSARPALFRDGPLEDPIRL